MLPPLVADANIAYAVVEFLRSQDVDVLYVREEGWQFYADQDILANAHAMRRFVLTHDPDFGTLAIHRNQAITGIIHLRQGERTSAEVIEDLQELLKMKVERNSYSTRLVRVFVVVMTPNNMNQHPLFFS